MLIVLALAVSSLTATRAAADPRLGWTTIPSPNPTARNGTLSDVSCVSDAACVGVGSLISSRGLRALLAQSWDGAEWIRRPAQQLPGRDPSLGSVSCASSTFCVAVGGYGTAPAQQTLAEHWDGTSWRIESTPKHPSRPNSVLTSVSCASASSCVAVGWASRGGTARVSLTAVWDGTAWTRAPAQDVAGAATTELDGVSCSSPTACTAVGYSVAAKLRSTLIEFWDGTAWTPQPAPNPDTNQQLSAVSCASASACTAVGSHRSSRRFPTSGLIASWDGTSWTTQPLGTVPGARQTALDSVSCPTASSCRASGTRAYYSYPGSTRPLFQSSDGSAWVNQAAPDLAGTPLTVSGLSCSRVTSCLAVGRSGDRTMSAFATSWDGTGWAAQRARNGVGVNGAGLDSVACAGADSCLAVGAQTVTDSSYAALAAHWDGSAWAPVPDPAPTRPADRALTAVSCGAPQDCVAVGTTPAGSVSAHWTGASLVFSDFAVPADGTTVVMTAVSCVTPNQCLAVGTYLSTVFSTKLLIELWNGQSWTIESTTVPADPRSYVHGASCSSLTSCTVVGAQDLPERHALVEHWDGSGWTVQASAEPAGGESLGLNAVSCPTATYCVAIGQYLQSGQYNTFIETWDGSIWTQQPSPNGPTTQDSFLLDVSCASPVACTAVGLYNEPLLLTARPLAERWDGASWQRQDTGAQDIPGAQLSGVGCPTLDSCLAVGNYPITPYGVHLTLTERYHE